MTKNKVKAVTTAKQTASKQSSDYFDRQSKREADSKQTASKQTAEERCKEIIERAKKIATSDKMYAVRKNENVADLVNVFRHSTDRNCCMQIYCKVSYVLFLNSVSCFNEYENDKVFERMENQDSYARFKVSYADFETVLADMIAYDMRKQTASKQKDKALVETA